MSNSDWDKLTPEQQRAVNDFRMHLGAMMDEEAEVFYRQHPELQVSWSLNLEALLRGQHDTLRDTK